MVGFSGRPAYQQIAEELRQQIVTGELAPGDRLPSATDLIARYGVSRQVAGAAIRELHHLGLIYGHPGKGTFVRPAPSITRRSRVWYSRETGGSPTAASVRAEGGVPSWEHHSAHSVADPSAAARLNVGEGAAVMVTTYVYKADGAPIQLATSWEPLAVTGGTAIEWPEDDSPAVGVVDRFDVIGVTIDRYDELVWARMPTSDEQRALSIGPGVPVMVIERTYLAGDRPVETADIVVPGDRYRLHYGIPVR